MSGGTREDKERQLRKNVEINTARSIKVDQEENRGEISDDRKRYYRRMFEESANRIDSSARLNDLWNPKPKTEIDTSGRPEFGYFGGVNFDQNGKIVK